MKKTIILVIILLLLTGCGKDITRKENIKEKEEVIDTYKDLNNTPIGIYELDSNNTLTKLSTINKTLNIEEDIGIFQIYPSNENIINLNTSFGQSFYNEWSKYKNIKLGFNIKYTLKNNETTSYNILNPDQTFDHLEYLMNYLYDDYANKDKSFYSHIESKDYNSNSLFTSIKIQSAYKCKDIKEIVLTVFTYDTDDDFINNEYRGNSYNKLIIKAN